MRRFLGEVAVVATGSLPGSRSDFVKSQEHLNPDFHSDRVFVEPPDRVIVTLIDGLDDKSCNEFHYS
jgi:hypothetical protein